MKKRNLIINQHFLKKEMDEIINKLKKLGKKYTIEYIGNNLNEFLETEEIDKILKKYVKKEEPRKIRASLDKLRGDLFEKIAKFLINEYFKEDKSYNHIKAEYVDNLPAHIRNLVERIRLHRQRAVPTKTPDIDLVVYSEKYNDRIIILSIKGTARERIGQFLSNIFIFDEKAIRAKYGNELYFFDKDLPKYKMIFICFEMAKQKDFSFKTEKELEKRIRSSVKQIEVFLIDDDPNVGYGLFVMNNLHKLQRVGNFSELVARLKKFFP